MELSGKYLLYNEYITLGGTISDETPFNLLEFQARKYIDKYTFGRLIDNPAEINNDIKICMFNLVNILNSYASIDINRNVASESIDGYNISYQNDFSKAVMSKESEIKDIIYTYLANCTLTDGTPLLYRGN